MGKRTDFPRRERDFYPTPYEAVVPLLPHLVGTSTFDDPCAGDGRIAHHLRSIIRCAYSSDIEPQAIGIHKKDARERRECQGDCYITNPIWDWPILTQIISHLSGQAPTWLLLNADLAHNKRMAPHMAYCVKIVSVGRVSWMGNGKKGFENCAWYLFDQSYGGLTKFYARAA